ncbi:hypothetical protein cypCar_00039217 [Cyprinus carpio]|nr:hypothetical protein cypCar_00039217 [Cyprinus carpio]
MMLSVGLFVSLVVLSVSVTGSSDGNPLDNDKWMSTVSQYDKSKYWNKFRDEIVLTSVRRICEPLSGQTCISSHFRDE